MSVLCPLGETRRMDGEQSFVPVVRIFTDAVMWCEAWYGIGVLFFCVCSLTLLLSENCL